MSITGPRTAPKRSPSVLVTDAREVRQSNRPHPQRTGTRIISVDNVLQYASDIPSAQTRLPPNLRPASHGRTPSGRHPLDPKLRGLPTGGAIIPARSSKISEKLVLLPETDEGLNEDDDEFDEDDESAPPRDEELKKRRLFKRGGKSDAERLPKSQRIADPQLARVTAYCTAQSFKLRAAATFVRDQHGAKTKLYDDCLYCVYQLPLLGGSDGNRVRSSPVVRNPGGRSVLDEQIEANERRQYRDGWHEESEEYSVPDHTTYIATSPPQRESGAEEGVDTQEEAVDDSRDDSMTATDGREMAESWAREHEEFRRESGSSSAPSFPSPSPGINPDAYTTAELFIFSYGVIVFWNFTANQEKDLLADMTFSSAGTTTSSGKQTSLLSQKSSAIDQPLNLPLSTRPLDEDDFETEEFHFQYDDAAEKPRIYNDMITLRTSDHMIKLAMSHGIAQSTKLCFFEERMHQTMSEAQYVPRRLALEGRLGMDRKEVVGLVGRLFEGRVDVNLSSNMLDTPNFFWDSEPTLHPLYQAVREYLEIKPRIQVLNERCQVFLDLAEILSDSIADVKMTRINWIVIALIALSIAVTVCEVVLRFTILAASGKKRAAGITVLRAAWAAAQKVGVVPGAPGSHVGGPGQMVLGGVMGSEL